MTTEHRYHTAIVTMMDRLETLQRTWASAAMGRKLQGIMQIGADAIAPTTDGRRRGCAGG